jgi:hypothetical protein
MPTTARRPHAPTISRTLGRILDSTRHPKNARNGWTVRTDGPHDRVLITLNHFTSTEDRAAFDTIREHLGDRYTLTYIPVLADYSEFPEDFDGCALIEVTPLPAPQEAPVDTTPAVADPHRTCEHRKSLRADHATTCPVYTDGLDNRQCACHYSDAQCTELNADADTVTLHVPAVVAMFFDDTNPEIGSALSAIDRDIAAAWAKAPSLRGGTVTALTTTRTIAAAFLATIEASAESEFYADDADENGATAALELVRKSTAEGLAPDVPGADYRMVDPAAQAALDAEIAADTERKERAAAEAAENARHADAWKTLTREERADRTQVILDSAADVFGVQRTDRAQWLDLGSITAAVSQGRLSMEGRRLSDPAAQPALDAAADALTAAGWTVTPKPGHLYAQPAA